MGPDRRIPGIIFVVLNESAPEYLNNQRFGKSLIEVVRPGSALLNPAFLDSWLDTCFDCHRKFSCSREYST